MTTVVMRLNDIYTDPDNPIDLASLPESEAVEAIQGLYGVISPLVEVSISDGVATITFPEENERKATSALRQIEDASRAAGAGNYSQAIKLYQQALKVLPTHTIARREMAMAMMEAGQTSAAKQNLIRVLQLDHNDAWAYLILGNLYFKEEQDLGSAERYYALAADLAPEDPYILNSYASLLAQRGKADEAEGIWRGLLVSEPEYPNPYLGLATVQGRSSDTESALDTLATLFTIPSTDPRNKPMYAQARKLYSDLRIRRASADSENLLQRVREILTGYESRTGIAIRLEEDPSLTVDAKVQLAWRHSRTFHRIAFKFAGGGGAFKYYCTRVRAHRAGNGSERSPNQPPVRVDR